MSLLKMQCENCGAGLSVNPNTQVYTCPFCNTQYKTQDVINEYHIKTDTLNAGIVNVNVHGKDINGIIKTAEALIDIKHFKQAYNMLVPLMQDVPQEKQLIYDLCQALTLNFARQKYNDIEIRTFNEYIAMLKKLGWFAASQRNDESDKKRNMEIWDYYHAAYKSYKTERDWLRTEAERIRSTLTETKDEAYENYKKKAAFWGVNSKKTKDAWSAYETAFDDYDNAIEQYKQRHNLFCGDIRW